MHTRETVRRKSVVKVSNTGYKNWQIEIFGEIACNCFTEYLNPEINLVKLQT